MVLFGARVLDTIGICSGIVRGQIGTFSGDIRDKNNRTTTALQHYWVLLGRENTALQFHREILKSMIKKSLSYHMSPPYVHRFISENHRTNEAKP